MRPRISSLVRLSYVPSVSRPIVVTFEEFKDRDEVLRKAGLVKGGEIHVTEDMSRKVRHNNKHFVFKLSQVRESRQELRRFMRDARRSNPACVCRLARYVKSNINLSLNLRNVPLPASSMTRSTLTRSATNTILLRAESWNTP